MSDRETTREETSGDAPGAMPAGIREFLGNSAQVRAIILIQRRRYREAGTALREHLTTQPDDAGAHAMLANVHRHLEEPEPAVAEAREAVRLDPNDTGYLTTLALALHEAGQRREAEKVIQAALALEPGDPAIRHTLGGMLLGRGKREEALAHAEAGLAVDPEHDGCAQLRALALSHLGRTDEAAAMAVDRLRRRPDDPEAHYDAAFAALHAGDAERAAVHFRETLRLNPTDDAAREGLAQAITGQRPVLGIFLRGLLWMSRQQSWAVWIALLAILIGPRLLRWSAGGNLAVEIIVAVVISVTQVLWLAWIAAVPLFNLSLWMDRENRHVLSEGQLRAVRWHAALLGLALLAIPLVMWFRLPALLTVIICVMATTLVETYYELEEEARPGLMRWYVAAVALVGFCTVAPMWVMLIGARVMGPEGFAEATPVPVVLLLALLTLLSLPMLIVFAVGIIADDWVAGIARRRWSRRRHLVPQRAGLG